MESVLGRYRNLTILVGVLFLQLLGLAVQVKRSGDAESTRLIRIWAVDTITPFERVLVWGQNGSGNLWHNYFYLRGVRAENRDLKKQIEDMRLKQVRLTEDAAQAQRLQLLLGFKEQFIEKTVAAQVIGSSGSDLSRSIYIDKGSNQGIATDMPVITAGGIVGKILRVYPSTSLVLMINDQTSGVGAVLEKSRLQGVLKGTPDGAVILERVMSDEQVAPGDTVLSSGGDQIFPKGLPVGTVTRVSPGKEMFLKIEVKPAADLSRLEEVLVVTEKQEKTAVVDSGVRVRAADILAQRLPSVPEKPVTDPAAGATPTPNNKAAAPAETSNGTASKTSSTPAKPAPNQSATAPAMARPQTASPAATSERSKSAANSTSTSPTEPAKKLTPKTSSEDSTASSATPQSSGSKPAASQAKPAATVPPKSPTPQPNPQPPTADDPH